MVFNSIINGTSVNIDTSRMSAYTIDGCYYELNFAITLDSLTLCTFKDIEGICIYDSNKGISIVVDNKGMLYNGKLTVEYDVNILSKYISSRYTNAIITEAQKCVDLVICEINKQMPDKVREFTIGQSDFDFSVSDYIVLTSDGIEYQEPAEQDKYIISLDYDNQEVHFNDTIEHLIFSSKNNFYAFVDRYSDLARVYKDGVYREFNSELLYANRDVNDLLHCLLTLREFTTGHVVQFNDEDSTGKLLAYNSNIFTIRNEMQGVSGDLIIIVNDNKAVARINRDYFKSSIEVFTREFIKVRIPVLDRVISLGLE